jgi:U3 small nucleolar RNA-associated protein 5
VREGGRKKNEKVCDSTRESQKLKALAMATKAPLVAFSEARDVFIVLSDDNRLKLWDAVNGSVRQDYAEKKHLSKSYTCLAWGQYSWAKRATKKKKGAPAEELMGTAAVGGEDGKIVLWDLARGKVKHELDVGEAVNDVAFSPAGDVLYSCSNDKNVLEWQVETGELLRKIKVDKGGATKICVCDDSLAAAGVSSTRLYSLSSGKAQKTLSGGSSSASCMSFACEGRFLLTASGEGRLVDLYDCKGSRELPVQTFTCDSSPLSMDVHVARKDRKAATLHVLCALASNQLNVWSHVVPLKEAGEDGVQKPKTPDGKIVVAARDGSSADMTQNGGFEKFTKASVANLKGIHKVDSRTAPAVLCACFCGGKGKSSATGKMMLARGIKAQPRFEVVQYASEGEIVDTIEVEPLEIGQASTKNGADIKAESKVAAATAESQIVTSLPSSSTKRVRGMSESSDASVSGTATEELSIGDRLKGLTGDLDFNSQQIEEAADAADAADAKPNKRARIAGLEGKGGAPPKADSLASYLEQALHTNDDSMLEKCLETRDATVIDATVERLQPSRVIPFLQKVFTALFLFACALISRLFPLQVIARFERRPTRAPHLSEWIHAVILRHTAFLVTVPDLSTKLGGFYRAIHDRVAHFRSFLKLSGKLDLILSQVEKHEHNDQQDERDAKRPKIVYYDGEGDGEEGADDDDDDEEEEEEEEEEE